MKKRQLDEKKIVTEILHGNEATLRFFYTHFARPLRSYIAHRIHSEEDTEEILQDVLLATLEGLRDFSFRSGLFTFICSIANHKVVDFYRKKRIKNIVFSRLGDIEPFLSTLLSPEEAFDEEILKEKIKATFQRIAPAYSKILKLKYIYGYSVTEIAHILSISFKSAESQLFRARRAFVANFSL